LSSFQVHLRDASSLRLELGIGEVAACWL
jgi:hypothetical protein